MKHIDKRVPDAEARIAQEIGRVSSDLSQMVRRVIRPLFDSVYCTILLIRVRLPLAGLAAVWLYGIVGLGLIRCIAPDFAMFTAVSRTQVSPLPVTCVTAVSLAQEEERLMSDFRSAHDRVSSSAESIAFADGGKLEEEKANEANSNLLALLHKKNNQRAAWNATESFFLRRTPDFVTQVLRMFWSFGQGTDGQVLAVEGGTRMANTSSFIGSLINNSFDAASSMLQMSEDFQQLLCADKQRVAPLLCADKWRCAVALVAGCRRCCWCATSLTKIICKTWSVQQPRRSRRRPAEASGSASPTQASWPPMASAWRRGCRSLSSRMAPRTCSSLARMGSAVK